ncbi:hypothetical protein SAMN05216197_1811, partial [Pseudomonas graminis]
TIHLLLLWDLSGRYARLIYLSADQRGPSPFIPSPFIHGENFYSNSALHFIP